MGWKLDIFQKFAVNFPAHGQIIPVKRTKSPHPGLYIAVKCPKAGPKIGTSKTPLNKTSLTLLHRQRNKGETVLIGSSIPRFRWSVLIC